MGQAPLGMEKDPSRVIFKWQPIRHLLGKHSKEFNIKKTVRLDVSVQATWIKHLRRWHPSLKIQQWPRQSPCLHRAKGQRRKTDNEQVIPTGARAGGKTFREMWEHRRRSAAGLGRIPAKVTLEPSSHGLQGNETRRWNISGRVPSHVEFPRLCVC